MTPFSEIDINDGDIFEATPDFLNIDSDRLETNCNVYINEKKE